MLKDRDFCFHFSQHLWYQFHQHFAWYQQLLMLWPQVNHRIQKRPFIHCQNLSVKLCSEIFLKKKHTKKWKVIFGKMMCTTSICFRRSRPVPHFTHFGLRGRDLFHFHQIIPKNPESKPPNPGNKYSDLETNPLWRIVSENVWGTNLRP